MTVLADSQKTGAVQAAERLLAARAGSPVSLAEPLDLGGSGRTQVLRVRVAKNPFSADRTLVIKVLGDGDTASGASFYREVASYKYANALPTESRPGPALIAFDLASRVLVLSDLGDGRSMTELLSSNDTAAVGNSVSAWGQALGRMHSATVGGENDFAALLRQGAEGIAVDALRSQFEAAVDSAPKVVTEMLGLTFDQGVQDALDAARDLFGEGDHRAFSPSDVGPENILINDDGVRFLDYEWGGFRDATLDIAYALVTFAPWLSPGSAAARVDLETRMLDAWRSEVQAIWPSLGSDRELARKAVVARLAWVWLSTMWMLPVDDTDVGRDDEAHGLALSTSDPRVIVDRWTALADAARRAGDPALAGFADSVGHALDSSWLH
ncbi:UNVERIFIED_CONTAM: thiamine kinase-like enzyme [Williamsia faeni]